MARALYAILRKMHDPEAHEQAHEQARWIAVFQGKGKGKGKGKGLDAGEQEDWEGLPDVPFKAEKGVLPGFRMAIEKAQRDSEPPSRYLLR